MTETLISVDIEAAGLIPGRYSMLSIGACLVDDLGDSFYVELQPVNGSSPDCYPTGALEMMAMMGYFFDRRANSSSVKSSRELCG